MAVEAVKKMMREYANHGNCVFVTSHNIELVSKLCDRVAFVNNGKVDKLFDLNRDPNRRLQLAKIFIETYGGK
jgi:ABC-2 type transport system ATP-binding protein